MSIQTVPPQHSRAGRPAAAEVPARMQYLLNTAAEVFLEQGFRNAKIEEIVRRAGASKSTLYARYRTKAELFVAVMTRKSEEVQESFAEALAPGTSLAQALEDFGSHLLSAVARPEQCALFKVFVAASPRFPELSSQFWQTGPEKSIRMLEDYLLQHPEFHGASARYAAEIFWSLCCGLFVLKSQFFNDFVLSKHAIEHNVREAVRCFLEIYGSSD